MSESALPVQLLVGLGNPGVQYSATRHNAGAWFVEQAAQSYSVKLQKEPKFQGLVGTASVDGQKMWFFLPSTFMNQSGQAVRAICDFYRIPPSSVLVAHDDLDFPPGMIRIKQEGGHGGHNGLRDIITHLNASNFLRLRIGIGHPGHRDQVHDYVLSPPSVADSDKIQTALHEAIRLLPDLSNGEIQKAIQKIHHAP